MGDAKPSGNDTSLHTISQDTSTVVMEESRQHFNVDAIRKTQTIIDEENIFFRYMMHKLRTHKFKSLPSHKYILGKTYSLGSYQ